MNWLALALGAAVFNALMDFFVKLAAGKIHDGLGGFVINVFATIVLLVFVIISKLKGEQIFNIKAWRTWLFYFSRNCHRNHHNLFYKNVCHWN